MKYFIPLSKLYKNNFIVEFAENPAGKEIFFYKKGKEKFLLKNDLIKALKSYNRRIGAGKKTLEGIDELEGSKPVVTGQQPGIFTGPIYTIYKAVTAIKLAKELKTVPVFWNASEDHDFEEVKSTFIGKNLEYPGAYKTCIYNIPLNLNQVEKMISEIQKEMPETEFKKEVLEKVFKCAKKSKSYSEFFSRLMVNLFEGLILVEPQILREFSIPIYEKVIKNPLKISEFVGKGGNFLEEKGYKRILHKIEKDCNFFFVEDERKKVFYNGEFVVNGEKFSQKEILEILYSNPEKFSSNVVLRPVVQDYLFSPEVYVGGPSEILYLAQLKYVYRFFDVNMAQVRMRGGATILERNISKILKKYGIHVLELRDTENLIKRFLKKAEFEDFQKKIEKDFLDFMVFVEEIDKSLVKALKKCKKNVLKEVGVLEGKTLKVLKKKNEILKNQIEKAHEFVFPQGDLQERKFNIHHFLILHGEKFLPRIFKELSEAKHVVIEW